jgi:hypothetical protein
MGVDIEKPVNRKKLNVRVDEDLRRELEEEYVEFRKEQGENWMTADLVVEGLLDYYLHSSPMTREYREFREKKQAKQEREEAEAKAEETKAEPEEGDKVESLPVDEDGDNDEDEAPSKASA